MTDPIPATALVTAQELEDQAKLVIGGTVAVMDEYRSLVASSPIVDRVALNVSIAQVYATLAVAQRLAECYDARRDR